MQIAFGGCRCAYAFAAPTMTAEGSTEILRTSWLEEALWSAPLDRQGDSQQRSSHGLIS